MNDTETTPAPPDDSMCYEPMAAPINPSTALAALLKRPGQILWEIIQGRSLPILAALAGIACVALAAYGVVAGSLTGGDQLWIAPAKILLGSLLAAAICLPSLFVFLCMTGADAHIRETCGLLLASVALTAMLLISFAPIVWVFSQSTDSIALMATLHLLLWVIAAGFGLRLLGHAAVVVWGGARSRLTAWTLIYLLVSLQMMTTLRPILGPADTFLPMEKQFFVTHWLRTLGGGQ